MNWLQICRRIRKEIGNTLSDYYRYIMVDEYQDTNVAQYLWLRLLAQGNNNICCVACNNPK